MQSLTYYYLKTVAGVINTDALPNHGKDPTGSAVSTILSIVFAITASVALLIIVVAGFRYVLARGDPNGVAQARNTILYAVIGLLISMAAFSIVNFVLKGIA